ncbi:hypothetical protein K458DRAFT_426170 [Lentithecium fluviatile CBS 122367]|uniref:Zn(2)-C6 fungal-type domain-containing protein n=1 Tax=Lentithecium fluviatile CBS 122367 TaxID=1168545 RepID=A0A6G1JKN8_9PLEO|nr:hypothetical protein K458DRAFT_426170 [Lentithecium fluviatile CBS 122367]
MPAVLHAPLTNTPGFMLNERTAEPLLPAFTAVNGRASPPSPRKLYAMNGMTTETLHVRPISRHSPERAQDPKASAPTRDDWNSVRNGPENGHQNGRPSPSLSDEGQSPHYPGKRKRSSSAEDSQSDNSPEGSVVVTRPRLDSYAPPTRDNSPNTVAQLQQLAMEHPQSRTLPPMERPDSERSWAQSRDVPHNGYHDSQHRDSRRMEHDGMNTHSASHSELNGMGDPNDLDHSNTTEMTRAGVQVDPKKRKRQFANRTKTGCGTCRRRKKKCDEAKPECNNCQRGGFICEGYANKVPWPKNGVPKPHPPLQARDRFPVDPAQLYHSHGTSRENYPETNGQNGTDGARSRPIAVEEHDRPPARNGWSGGWSEPPRASYPPEQHQPAEYSQPPQTPTHGRPPSSEQHVPPSSQAPSSRQHNPRIYHHTPQTMSQVVNNSPAVTAEAALHHQSQHPHQPPMAPPTAGPPAPPPSHFAPPPPPPQRSEKEKMLTGEPFQPFAPQLLEERERCKGAVYRFNNTSNSAVDISRDTRDRHFREILMARWTHHSRGNERPVCGHLGPGVYVDTPFMCDYGYNLSIADNVEIGTHCKLQDSGRISIGRNSTIGANVTIDTQRTPNDSKSIKGVRRTAVAAEVHIGENVHIGSNCTILAGVSIGNGAIIHPGSVVVRDIPAQCIARGPPADYV